MAYKPLIPCDQRPPVKRYRASQIKSKWEHVQQDNYLLNEAFMRLLTRIKSLYNGSGVRVFEHDHRKDLSEPTSVHSFITKNLILELECEYVSYRAKLYYDLNNCPYEAQIRKWLKGYPFSISSIQRTPQGGIEAYFDRILAFQGDSHFTNL